MQSIESSAPNEVALEWASPTTQARLQVVARYPAAQNSVVLRGIQKEQTVCEQVLFAGPAPMPPYCQAELGACVYAVQHNGEQLVWDFTS